MVARSADKDLVLYQRTSPEATEQIMRERSMGANGNDAAVTLSNRTDGATGGDGSAVVQLRVPAKLVELAEKFPDGEQRYRVRVDALRAENFVATWPANPQAPTAQTGVLAGAELRAGPDAERHDLGDDDAPVAVSDSTGITPANPPVAVDPGPPQVDLDLGEAVYRQVAARGGFTPESTAAAEVTIFQAVASRQAVSTADRLHALADEVETARDNRATTTTVPAPPRLVSVAPPPRVEVARARAASAQIWDDTRDEYDAPAVAERH